MSDKKWAERITYVEQQGSKIGSKLDIMKILHAAEQQSPCATTTETAL